MLYFGILEDHRVARTSKKYRYSWSGDGCTRGYICYTGFGLEANPHQPPPRITSSRKHNKSDTNNHQLFLTQPERTHNTVDSNIPLPLESKLVLDTNIPERTNSHASSHHLRACRHLPSHTFLSAPQYFECQTSAWNHETSPPHPKIIICDSKSSSFHDFSWHLDIMSTMLPWG